MPPRPETPDLQVVLAASYLREQQRRISAEAELASGNEKIAAVLAFQRDVLEHKLDLTPALVAERALQITGADGAAVALSAENDVRCFGCAGRLAPEIGTRISPTSRLSYECLQTGYVTYCPDLLNDERVPKAVGRDCGIRSILAVPIRLGEAVIGLVEVFSAARSAFVIADSRVLELLAATLSNEAARPVAPAGLLEANTAEQMPVCIADLPAPVEVRAETHSVQDDRSDHVLEVLDSLPSFSATEHQWSELPFDAVEASAPVVEEVAPTAETSEFVAPAAAPVAVPVADPTPAAVTQLEPLPATESQSAAASLPTLDSSKNPAKQNPWLQPKVLYTVASILLAASVVTSSYWGYKRLTHRKIGSAPAPAAPVAEQPATAAPEIALGPAELSKIEFYSHEGFSTVKINLTGPVRYRADRLTNPNRIFVDLADTRLVNGTRGETAIDVGDKYLAKIRAAQKESGATRVVLDMNCSCVFVPVLSRTPPFALLLTVQPSDAAPDHPADHVEVTAREKPVRPEVLKPTPEPLAKAMGGPIRIAIDPGHGGWDKGTVGSKGLEEKELVLAIAQRLGHLVAQKLGGEVVFTRTDDTFVPLQSRATLANEASADLLISIHGNSSPYRSVRGIETFVAAATGKLLEASDTRMTESRKLARSVQHSMFARLAEADPGLHDRGVKSAPLVVLAETTMPSILIELSFVSSPIEERKLMEPAYRDQIAQALFDGIAAYVSTKRKATNSAHLEAAAQTFGN